MNFPWSPTMENPFRQFNCSPDLMRLTTMMYIWYPLSLRQVEDILFERGIDICHETVRLRTESDTAILRRITQRHSVHARPVYAIDVRCRRILWL